MGGLRSSSTPVRHSTAVCRSMPGRRRRSKEERHRLRILQRRRRLAQPRRRMRRRPTKCTLFLTTGSSPWRRSARRFRGILSADPETLSGVEISIFATLDPW